MLLPVLCTVVYSAPGVLDGEWQGKDCHATETIPVTSAPIYIAPQSDDDRQSPTDVEGVHACT
jgi:hypothetical protein